jgi:hypothetical protein
MGKARSLKEARELAAELSESTDPTHPTSHLSASHSDRWTAGSTHLAAGGWCYIAAMVHCHGPLPRSAAMAHCHHLTLPSKDTSHR